MSVVELLGLRTMEDPLRFQVHVHEGTVTAGGALQGGAGTGAVVTAMELASGRPTAWVTGHFLRHAAPDAVLDLEVELCVVGHRVTQAAARLSAGDQEVMRASGAFGTRDLGLEHTWVSPIEAPPPQRCPVRPEFALGDWEARRAVGRLREELDGSPGPGRSATWFGRPGGKRLVTPGELAMVGDCCALEVSDAVGFYARNNSLDNTLRMVEPAETEWILSDVRISSLQRGFATVTSHLWSENGVLMAVFSQTLVVRRTTEDGEVIRTGKLYAG